MNEHKGPDIEMIQYFCGKRAVAKRWVMRNGG